MGPTPSVPNGVRGFLHDSGFMSEVAGILQSESEVIRLAKQLTLAQYSVFKTYCVP